jgi:hypothetical protein
LEKGPFDKDDSGPLGIARDPLAFGRKGKFKKGGVRPPGFGVVSVLSLSGKIAALGGIKGY